MSNVLSRTESREVVFRVLYAEQNDSETLELAMNGKTATEPELKFINKILCYYQQNKHEIDALITGERIKKIDLAILKVAITELKINEVKREIIINEAINMAKKYSDGESPSFINGVLGQVK